MNLRLYIFTLACAALPVIAETGPTETKTAILHDDVIASINGDTIPREWFVHEFRSTFFRHLPSDNVRQAVFKPFLNRMLLRAKAQERGLNRDPELQGKIKKRISDMRTFMDYQLAMAEVEMLNNALLQELGISITKDDVTQEELELYFENNIKPMPGAPASLSLVPPHLIDSLKAQTAQKMHDDRLAQLIMEWEMDMEITINSNAIDSVPMPDMKGNVPPGVNGR